MSVAEIALLIQIPVVPEEAVYYINSGAIVSNAQVAQSYLLLDGEVAAAVVLRPRMRDCAV